MREITYRSAKFYDFVADHADKHVHLIMIATKPDIIKQIPLYMELKKRRRLVVLGHTGQHYDENLSGGMLKEFGVNPDFNLNVRGSMYEVVSQIIGRLGHVIGEIKNRGKIVIPYVHGDTTTAMASGNAGYCHMFASVHVEAGIRTLTPRYGEYGLCHPAQAGGIGAGKKMQPRISGFKKVAGSKCQIPKFEEWRQFLMDRGNWERGSQEPYPEQFNTRCSEAATGVHLAPVELDREFMLGEGFSDDRIFVVGNSVADATKLALRNSKNTTVFDRYPVLADGDFARFCIHRRENCVSELRFCAIFGAMKRLVESGRKILLINMNQTKKAFENFGLRGEVEGLAKDYDNFVLSEVWPEYGDVIAAMNRAAVCVTDSGSMQEEMNIMGVPCVTLRFGSDRSESVMAGGNIIAPPVDSDLIVRMIEGAWDNDEMKNVKNIYGENVSKKSVDIVLDLLGKGDEVFRNEEGRLGIYT